MVTNPLVEMESKEESEKHDTFSLLLYFFGIPQSKKYVSKK